MKNPIQTFEPNEVGRDFVIGDLHGSLSCFQNLIKNLNFDPTKDRMFSVGDLSDRGPDSLGCLELLHAPWFHSVLSNHEIMMLEAFSGGYVGSFWNTRNGARWGHNTLEKYRAGLDLDPDDLRLLQALTLVQELPFLITIKMKGGKKFHVLHAELPPNARVTDQMLEDPELVLRLANVSSDEGEFFLWGRHLFREFYRGDLTNLSKIKRTVKYSGGLGIFNDELSHIISGHTIVTQPLTIGGQTNIDTGASGSYTRDARQYEALTCIELQTWKFYQATESAFRAVEPVVVNSD